MTDIITTAEELAALPVGSVFIDGLDNIGFRQEQGFLVPTGTWRDSMDKRSPTKWQTAEQVIRDSCAWGYDALPLTVLYRPDQPAELARVLPSRERVRSAIQIRMSAQLNYRPDLEGAVDAVLDLFANAPTVEQVKAEALREHRRRVVRFMPAGLVNRATVLADLDDYANRLAPTQPVPDVPEVGLPTPEVPSVGGEDHG